MGEYSAVMAHGMFSLSAGRVAQELSVRTGLPFSVHLHGSDVNVVMKRDPISFANTLEAAKAAVFVSRALLETAQTQGYRGQNHFVIPNGVDTNVFKPKCIIRPT